MNLENLLEKRNTIYGFCAIWIVLFHVFRRISMPYFPVITNIISDGNMAVDIFLFFSGLCLAISVKRCRYEEIGWGEYYKKRFARVVIPYLIICIPYYLWNAFVEHGGSVIRKLFVFCINISSASFWIRGMQTTWFVYAIVLFYLLFPILYKFLCKCGMKKAIILVVWIIVAGVMSAYIPIVKNSMIVWARLPIFTIGIIIGIRHTYQKVKRDCKKQMTVLSIVILVLLGWLTSMIELTDFFAIPPVYRLLIYIPMALALLYLVSRTGSKIKLLEWVGGLSLEVYLIHITLLHPLAYYGILERTGNWTYIILPLIAVMFAGLLGLIEKRLLSKHGA